MRSRWKNFRYRLEEWAVRAIAALIPRLPRPIAWQLGRGAGTLASHLDRPGWKVALANLKSAFGDRYSASEREAIARESYRQFAGTMMNLFWSPRLDRENFRRLIEYRGLDELKGGINAGPRIFVCLHYGDFEMLSLGSGWVGLKSYLITQEFKNRRLDPIFNHLRTRSGHEIVARDGGIVRLYKALRRGGSVAILIDLALQLHQPAVAIDCFGMKTAATFAHAWLAKRTGAPIVPVHAEPLPGGRCRVIFHREMEIAEGETHQAIAQRCWDRFEPVIARHPSPWLWMYKYWRYEPENLARSYPDYARRNPRFDALIRQDTRRSHETQRKKRNLA